MIFQIYNFLVVPYCDGNQIPDGACDCEGNTLDCLGVCGGLGPEEGFDCNGIELFIDKDVTDFPDPDSPTMPNTSPLNISNETPSTALAVPASV